MTCKNCSLKCIASDCECICHHEYKLLQLPRQTTCHYFHNGKSACGRVEIGVFSKIFTPKEGVPICKNCAVVVEMRQKWIANNSE